ncbi:MAG TPA: TolC family protein, partial [Candidatus Paceibacterota bacterium]|nr:TolC family protein [Candidatus Paceibacterota bacterium]
MKTIPHSSTTMRALTVLAASFAAATSTLAQTNETRIVRALSLEDCIGIALEHNFDVQIYRYNPRIDRFDLASRYGAYDPVFSASGRHDYNMSGGGVDQQGRPYGGTETDTDSLRAGVSGLLPWGLSYDLGGNMSDQTGSRPTTATDFSTFTVQTNTIYGPGGVDTGNFLLSTNYGTVSRRSPFETTSGQVGVLTLQQPLLKNFWIDSTRLGIAVQKLKLKSSEADFRDTVMTTVWNVETAYYTLIYADENIRVREKALEVNERLLAENRKRVEVGAMAPLDEKAAEAEVATSRAALIQARVSRENQERTLKNLLSDR